MTLSIRTKIFLAILATALISLVALQQMQRHNFEKGLRKHSRDIDLERLQPIVIGLEALYSISSDWSEVAGQEVIPVPHLLELASKEQGVSVRHLRLSKRLMKRKHRNKQHRHQPKPLIELSLFDADKKWVAGFKSDFIEPNKAVNVDGKVVGYLALNSSSAITRHLDKRFSAQQTKHAFWAIGLILVGAVLFALLISRSLSKPINNLLQKVQHLSDGNYDINTNQQRNDELGMLEQEFDKLAESLHRNRQHRQQWVSDIAHELRTPVAVLKGELECIEDGHQPLDMDSVKSLKSEVERLNLLIEDLHQLSQSDSGSLRYQFQELNIAELIQSSLNHFQENFAAQKIRVDTNFDELPLIKGDTMRLKQVFDNLLQNTLRYTDVDGQLAIAATVETDTVNLKFEDSSPSVPDHAIDKLFDRLYRVDESRNRSTGASGLGLAICAAIIEAHQGTISAAKSVLGGLAITITLPRTED